MSNFAAGRPVGAIVFIACLWGAGHASAQGRGPGGYPLKPVRVVVANVPGGTTDLVARVL
ncbi:MAG: tripartite tricarboxylate transporter substrate binding protein, partial [Proteobacteria bacterium]|nr:tripartite tricarboxylate transporter substrate binding protein [Burkholderiales bacterium]